MDLNDLSIADQSKKGQRLVLTHPKTHEPLTHREKAGDGPREMFVVLLGPDSPVMRRGMARIQNREKLKKPNHVPSNEQLDRERESDAKFLDELTIGGEVFFGGKWVDLSKESAFDLYNDVAIIRGQALTFALDSGNFIRG